ncbi:MAG: molybdopterin molybdotransferase MoeA [Elusimicrobia bacterium]|nr:molybdopterin molybdotransferase MoeA [Elusimicrobiota bacterium]
MITPEEALRLILENTARLSAESVPLADSVGRVLAEDIYSKEDLPPFDNSAMDGFAVRLLDCSHASRQNPALLTIKETVRAGTLAQYEVQPGEAVKIMTGAPIPKGADAVVMKEVTRPEENGQVSILQAPESGDHIRCHGEDIRAGVLILTKGIRIRPYEVALLAAQGIDHLFVVKKPRISILATGDELMDVAESLTPGKIRNSNGPALAAALARWEAAVQPHGIVKDDPVLMRKALEASSIRSDVLLVSGGVSVGDFDYTKILLEELGLKVVFWKAAIKPGKPLLFGLWNRKLVFGLPGNPVSAMVCLEEFVRPALEKLQGHAPGYPSYHLSGRAANDYPKPKDRQQYLFCQAEREENGYKLQIIRPQGSAMLGMACKANALAIAPLGVSRVKQGDTLVFRWLK